MNIHEIKFISIGKKDITINEFNLIQNNEFKPNGGLWAAIYDEKDISMWYQFCLYNLERDISNGVIFNLKPDANIFIVDNYLDYSRLIDITGSVKHDEGVVGRFGVIDYKSLYNTDIDGVYFTLNAIETLGDIHYFYGFYNHNYNKIYKGIDMSLYGYDSDSLVLFNINCINDKISVIINENGEVLLK